jgi:hypothetical protein
VSAQPKHKPAPVHAATGAAAKRSAAARKGARTRAANLRKLTGAAKQAELRKLHAAALKFAAAGRAAQARARAQPRGLAAGEGAGVGESGGDGAGVGGGAGSSGGDGVGVGSNVGAGVAVGSNVGAGVAVGCDADATPVLYHRVRWLDGGNPGWPACAATAVANHLLAWRGITASPAEILALHLAAGGDGYGAHIEDVLEVAASSGLAGTRIARFWPVADARIPGLVTGLRLSRGSHTVLSLGGAGCVSWGQLYPLAGVAEEAWWIEWSI